MSAGPVLDIDGLEPERPWVRITSPLHPDGKGYDMNTLDDLSLADRARMGHLQKRLQELEPVIGQMQSYGAAERKGEAGDLTVPDPAEMTRVEESLNEFLLLSYRGLEDEVLHQLTLEKRLVLIRTFLDHSPMTEGTATEAEPPISDSPSPDSKQPTQGGTPSPG